MMRLRYAASSFGVALAVAGLARAEEPPAPGFLCLGESESLARGTTLDEIAAERDRRLAALDGGTVSRPLVAHTHCVVAELMRRLGDVRAGHHYRRAIALNPREPAYELWYGRYLGWARGAGAPLAEDAERHYGRALDKLEGHAGVTQAGPTDDVTRAWSTRNLLSLFQEDGLPLLPYSAKAYPFAHTHAALPQLFLALDASVARDTTDFWDLADSRRFTSEAQQAQLRALPGTLSDDTLTGIARAPVRYDALARLRLRQGFIGLADGYYRRAELLDSQITSLDSPAERNDVSVEELGVGWRRSFGIYPLFDAMLEAGASGQDRTGLIEGQPDRTERIYIYRAAPTLSRYIGASKLTLTGAYVYFDIEDNRTGALDERPRERVVRLLALDLALYRPLVLPQLQAGTWQGKRVWTRGLHFFLSAMSDDERFGTTVVRKGTYSGGAVLKGVRGLDFLLSGSVFTSATEVNQRAQDELSNSQFRSSLRVLDRLVDEETEPGLPSSPLTSLTLAGAVRHDAALSGLDDYESVRGGVELWGKLLALGFRGTTFLLSAAAEVQYFYRLERVFPLGQLTLRMGWPSFGTLPAYF